MLNEAAKEIRRKYMREWQRANPDKVKAAHDRYRARKAERTADTNDDAAIAGAKEARKAYKREWQRANPDKVRAQQERYWARTAERAAAENAGRPAVSPAN